LLPARSTNVVTCLHRATVSRRSTITITTLSSREFNQDTSRAKKAASKGPVFITDRGKPAHVLLSIDGYQRLSGQRRNLVDALSMPGLAEIEFDPPRLGAIARPADLS
jgi:prevent-host-death family protein